MTRPGCHCPPLAHSCRSPCNVRPRRTGTAYPLATGGGRTDLSPVNGSLTDRLFLMVQKHRADRYSARRFLWRNSAMVGDKAVNPGLRRCGRLMHSDVVTVRRTVGPDGSAHAGFGGLVTCGSAWSCPVCAAKIAARRSTEIGDALAAWIAGGGEVALLTLTMRHHAKRDGVFVTLLTLWSSLITAWGLVTTSGGRWWKDVQDGYGAPMTRVIRSGKREGQVVTCNRIRMIRVVEVTHGRHGWHPHLHVLLLLPAGLGPRLETLRTLIAVRWADALTSLGLERPGESAVDARFMTEAEARAGVYLTKSGRGTGDADDVDGLAQEVAYGASKTAKRTGSNTPFQLLNLIMMADAAGRADTRSMRRLRALWREWETVSRGRRQIAWSAGLREELRVEVLEDAEIAEEVVDGDVVGEIEAGVWAYVCESGSDYAILSTFERDLWAGTLLLTLLAAKAGDVRRHRSPAPVMRS